MRRFVLLWTAVMMAAAFQPLMTVSQSPCSEGSLIEGAIDSARGEVTVPYYLYLPPCHDTTTAYPVVYLFHGTNNTHEQWINLGIADVLNDGIRMGWLPPMAVVMPHGRWMASTNRFDDRSWEAVFLNELLPHIEQTYPVSSVFDQRGIGGISRGGFWAYSIALRHPQLFSAVGGHSAFFDPQNAPADHNPLTLTDRAVDRTRYWLDRGADDYAAFGLDLMGQRFPQARYRIYPQGEHNADYWRVHLPAYLAFYAAEWPGGTPLVTGFNGAEPHYVPVSAFVSGRASLHADRIASVWQGALDEDLILTPQDAQALRGRGIAVHPRTRIVSSDTLTDQLERLSLAYSLRPLKDLTPAVRVLSIRTDEQIISPFDWPPLTLDATRYAIQRAQLTRFTFSGVTALARGVIPVLDARGVDWASSGIRDYTQQSDYFHMSNEVSFAPRCPLSDEPVLGGLCSKDAHFPLFTLLGADIIELTGNHNNDYNFSAYLRTLDLFTSSGMQTVGGGATLEAARQPLILEHNGHRIGVLACNWNGPQMALATEATPGATFCERDWLREAIPALRLQVDVVLVGVQYAEYERLTPIQRQIDDFAFIADLGADVVMGSQAHRPQVLTRHTTPEGRTVLIDYGVGNLYFDQNPLPNRQFTLDTVLVYEGRVIGLELAAGVIEDVTRPRWMTADEEISFLRDLMR